MSEHAMAHFHNGSGAPEIRVSVKEFMCIGAPPPFDHPHIFIDLGDDDEHVCPYCSTLYRYTPALAPGAAKPEECVWHDEPVAKSAA